MMDETRYIPYSRECPCMRRIRYLDGDFYKNANRTLQFTAPMYVINPKYLEGKATYPVTRVFEHRNIMGRFVSETCKCIDMFDWENHLPRHVLYSIRSAIYTHQQQSMKRLCKCGKELVRSLRKEDGFPLRTYFCCAIKTVTPYRYVYRIDGKEYSTLCHCYTPREPFSDVEESVEEQEDSDSDSD